MKKQHLYLIGFLSFLFAVMVQPAVAFPFVPRMDSIKIVFDDQQLVLPGESFHIGIVSYYKNGKIKSTVGMKGGTVWWRGYKVAVSGGTDNSGRISISETLISSKVKYVGIKAWPRKQPELVKELLIPLNYETKITYSPTEVFDKAPGSQIRGNLIAGFNNGMQRVCSNLRNRKEAANFELYGEGGSWKSGIFTIEPDFTKIIDHRASLIVNSLRNTAVSDTFSVLLDYRHGYDLQSQGGSGATGFSGSAGSPGLSGSQGGNGQNGLNGEFGYNGPDMNLWVDLYRDSLLNCDLLYVFAQNLQSGEESRYLINPDGGSLTVTSRGGSGGDGGSGGNGGDGGSGNDGQRWTETRKETKTVQQPVTEKVTRKQKIITTNSVGKEIETEVDVEVNEVVMVDTEVEVDVNYEVQEPGEDGGDGAWGGAGGFGGEGGYGGNITLYFTDDARPYEHLFIARSEGGSGGMNGSGGNGGYGGPGGQGNPNGSNGGEGQSGPSAIGWANNGADGQIIVDSTDAFFFYTPKEQITPQ